MQVSGFLDGVTEALESREDAGSNVETAAEIARINANGEDEREGSEGGDNCGGNSEDDRVADISGRHVEFSMLENADESLNGLYVYKNVFNLIPRSVGRFGRLKRLKFFGNEIDLFPSELGNLEGLEFLQVKLSAPGFSNGLSLNKLKDLKELELSKVPRQSSVLAVLSEIFALSRLNKLSVCCFSIRYLPPEIGCLKSLEFLELSFNKLKALPKEICHLTSLKSLKVAHNKLVDLPSGLTSLQMLEIMDLSNNRLTSLGSLDLHSMHNLQNLNLQYNKLQCYCRIPSWISCNLEGNVKDSSNNFISSPVEMDINETSFQENIGSTSYKGSHRSSICISNGHSSNSRSSLVRRGSRRWKRRQHYFQHKARQERLNNSRKWKGEGIVEGLTLQADGNCRQGKGDMTGAEAFKEGALDSVGRNGGDDDDQLLPAEAVSESSSITSEVGRSSEDCASDDIKSAHNKERKDHGGPSASSASTEETSGMGDNILSKRRRAANQTSNKSKRHSDRDLDNPKACKIQRPAGNSTDLSKKYTITSFFRSEDLLPDGFYDAGRDRPFMPLWRYEQILNLDSREVILVDRETDEELDAITCSAQRLISHLKRLNGLAKGAVGQSLSDNLQIASLLALFVSDHFGGSDRSALVQQTRKSVSGSNYQKPFVCTCSTGNSETLDGSTKLAANATGDVIFTDICEKSIHSIKLRRNSIVVPIGTLQYGVCRHRALLMKYLCDRMDPPIPCELVRGYLDFLPHAWNVVPVKKGNSWIRMIVDACHPHEIKEESDPEYFCRYVPVCRVNVPAIARKYMDMQVSYPSLSSCDEIEKSGSSSLIHCKLGSVEAAAKVRTLEVSGASAEEVRNFEYSCLGEVRMLSVLDHSCIVKMYGHQISYKWLSSADGNEERRIVQSSILMEYIKGGSLKRHIEKLAKAGDKLVPVDLALKIARDVACAVAELHSKHIIHRDIKSENILIDLTVEGPDEAPVVKLCDFDRAVPLRSLLHSCCIAHAGISPPDVCVGTPRWMAPEVICAMHQRRVYGLEVDIWSYGCLIFEILTLQVPYSGFSELQIHDALQMGKRPRLLDELEALRSLDDHKDGQYQSGLDLPKADLDTLKFLIDLFYQCTSEAPSDRPTAGDIYHMLLAHSSKLTSSKK